MGLHGRPRHDRPSNCTLHADERVRVLRSNAEVSGTYRRATRERLRRARVRS